MKISYSKIEDYSIKANNQLHAILGEEDLPDDMEYVTDEQIADAIKAGISPFDFITEWLESNGIEVA